MIGLGLVFCQLAFASAPEVSASDRVLDGALGMWRIENSTPSSKSPLGIFSPDGARLAIVVSRGQLADNVTESELRSYKLAATGAREAASEEILLRRTTRGNAPAIDGVRWLRQAHSIAFLGMPQGRSSDDARQVYVMDLKNRLPVQRTHSPTPILGYGISDDGLTIVYAAKVVVDSAARERQRLSGVIASGDQVGFLYDSNTRYGQELDYFVQRGKGPARRVYRAPSAQRTSPVQYFESAGFVEVSPNGRNAIVGMHMLPSTPPIWLRYRAGELRDFIDERKQSPPTYALIDVPSGTVGLLMDSPSTWGGTTARWSPDGKRVFVMGYLPIDSANPSSSAVAQRSGSVLEVELSTRRVRTVAAGLWRIANVATGGDTVLLSRDGYTAARDSGGTLRKISTRTIVRADSTWRTIDSTDLAPGTLHPAAAVVGGLRFIAGINETLDRAPEVSVFDRLTGQTRVITSLNPQLAQLPRGAIRRVTWTSSRNDKWEGHLVIPVGYSPDKRYPAVIMMMDMNYNDEFVLDGRFYRSAYPVQALANRGIAVLMAYFPPIFYTHYVDSLERPIILGGMDGAFDFLVREGVADSTRVGITGFSHSGFVVQYSISKSKHRYAAAVAIDNFDASYLGYMLFQNVAGMQRIDTFYGGNPFGPAMDAWRREAPGFTLADVHTPLLLEYHNAHTIGEQGTNVAGWETYAGLRSLRQPVELARYPYGEHVLRKPSESNSSARRQVDWLTFWLEGEIDPAVSKRDQYARWTDMKSRASAAVQH